MLEIGAVARLAPQSIGVGSPGGSRQRSEQGPRQQPEANNGDIVAAMIDGEATVKTFKRTPGQVWLLPHNAAYEPIDGNAATILGKVTAVLRRI